MSQCSYPYVELQGNHCGIHCNHGFFVDVENDECSPCVDGCKVCADDSTCAYCFELDDPRYDSSCRFSLTCPMIGFDYLYIHDYNSEVDRCVSACEEPNSFVSYREDIGLNSPQCRYCGEGCLDCKEDDDNTNLYCTRCEGTLIPSGSGCV